MVLPAQLIFSLQCHTRLRCCDRRPYSVNRLKVFKKKINMKMSLADRIHGRVYTTLHFIIHT